MRQKWTIAAFVFLVSQVPAIAQQPSVPARPSAILDVAAIRKQAAQMGEVRGLLADPDPNVRLIAIREIARSGDPIQRQLAIDAGLSSAESSMQEVALRAVVADTQQVMIALSNLDGSVIKDGEASLSLHISKFDPDTGRITGDGWTGQIQGAVFSFAGAFSRPGSLVWNSETGEFVGTYNVEGGPSRGLRKAVWRPR